MKQAIALIVAVLPAALVAQQFDPTKAPTRPVGNTDPRTLPKLPGSNVPVELRVGPGGKDTLPLWPAAKALTVKAGAPITLSYFRPDDMNKPIKTNVRLESSDDPGFATIKHSALVTPKGNGVIELTTSPKPFGFGAAGTTTLYLRAKTGSLPSNSVAITTTAPEAIH